jgi:hypothetical protein
LNSVPSLDPSFDLEGPLDVAPFPDTLSARVVTPGPRPRLHGYDVEGDLARHYDATDLLVLSLTGELPTPEASRAVRVALAFFAPLSVAHASVHAATLARVCGTASHSTIGVAAIALGEQVRVLLDEHAELLKWLAAKTGPLPEAYRATDPAERDSVTRLCEALVAAGFAVPELDSAPRRNAALICVLVRCGLKERSQLEAAIVTARLPSAVAEAMSVKVAGFDQYPTNLPRYSYRDSR